MRIRFMKLASVLATMMSGLAWGEPEYLYWMVDLDAAGKNPYGVSTFTYATVKEAGGSSYLYFYDTNGNPVGNGMNADPGSGGREAGPLYTGLGDSVNIGSTYLFELWLEDDIDPVTRVGYASYTYSQLSASIYKSMGSGSGNTPFTIGVIPEPSSALLVLVGFAALALRRRGWGRCREEV